MQTIEVSEEKNSKKAKLVEEWAPEDRSTYDICMQNIWKRNCFYEENIGLKEKVETSSAKVENKEVVKINYLPPTGKPKKSRKLRFSAEERRNILNGKVLTDESTNLTQSILAKQFPNIAGFMDTCLGKTQQFDVAARNKPYVQIIHAGSLHWICVANTLITKNDNGIYYLYDSLSCSEIMIKIVKQVASYSCHPEPVITLVTKAVQQQKNVVDCELFVIPFATTLAFGGDPATIAYDFVFKTTFSKMP